MAETLKTILNPDIQRIFDHFSVCFDMRIVFFSAQGEMVRQCRNRPDSRYCELLRQHIFGVETCRRLDYAQCVESARCGRLLCYECHAGLIEASVPIYYVNQLLGFVSIGQLRSRKALPQDMAAAWEAAGHEREELARAYDELPLASTQQIEAILDLFSLLVEYLVSQRIIALGGSSVLEEVLAYMEAHVEEEVTLTQAARLVKRSQSTISHLFTKQLGRSFKQTLIDIKLRRAEQYLREHPQCTIADAAASVGYSDSLYFSRLYRRYRSMPPSEFLKRQNMMND